MIIVTLSIAIPPGWREEILRVFWSLLGPLRVEPGCLGCGIYQEVGNADVLLYVEEWETQEHLERHVRSARYERLLGVMEAAAKPPQLRYHVVCGVKGLEYLEAVRLGGGAFPTPAKDQPTPPETISNQQVQEVPTQ
jgi:quinol monooxygenase YgiN